MADNVAVTAFQIVNWRKHGEDESYCKTGLVLPGEDLTDGIRAELDYPKGNDDYDAESAEDWDRVYYVNDNFYLRDGEVLEHSSGRKFMVRFHEITDAPTEVIAAVEAVQPKDWGRWPGGHTIKHVKHRHRSVVQSGQRPAGITGCRQHVR